MIRRYRGCWPVGPTGIYRGSVWTANSIKPEGLPSFRCTWIPVWRNDLTHPPPLLALRPLCPTVR